MIKHHEEMPATSWFFGYGSLVNCKTHDYPDTLPARLEGWQRQWVQTDARPFCFLSADNSATGFIDGLIARVPDNNWKALDLREKAYVRHSVGHLVDINHEKSSHPHIQVYSVPHNTHENSLTQKPILLSYLDVVLSEYQAIYGHGGMEHFVETTSGWQRPVLNDRPTPLYPRHQPLDMKTSNKIDDILASLPCNIIDVL